MSMNVTFSQIVKRMIHGAIISHPRAMAESKGHIHKLCEIMLMLLECMGPLLDDFLKHGAPIHAEVLWRSPKSKSTGILLNCIILLRDNACPHAVNMVQNMLQGFGWENASVFSLTPRSLAMQFPHFSRAQERRLWTSMCIGWHVWWGNDEVLMTAHTLFQGKIWPFYLSVGYMY